MLDIILKAIDDVNGQLPPSNQVERSASARLTGEGGTLDSMGLVNLIVAVERRVQEELHQTVVLTTERTLADSESVFATVGSLAAHVEQLLAEK